MFIGYCGGSALVIVESGAAPENRFITCLCRAQPQEEVQMKIGLGKYQDHHQQLLFKLSKLVVDLLLLVIKPTISRAVHIYMFFGNTCFLDVFP